MYTLIVHFIGDRKIKLKNELKHEQQIRLVKQKNGFHWDCRKGGGENGRSN